MRICNLSSGSDGNLTYVEVEDTKLLVDVGLSCSETVKRLNLLGIRPHEIDGIVVTHEHGDHTKGVDLFASKYGKDIYANINVWDGLDRQLKKVKQFNRKIFYEDTFNIARANVTPVRVPHDVPCYGFSIDDDKNKISIITDLGHTSYDILNKIKGSKLVYLESNYDVDMLKNGKYPPMLKARIAGNHGHLSNECCADFINDLVRSGARQIVLSHLSRENNTPNLAYSSVTKRLEEYGVIEGKHVKIDVATIRPGNIFRIREE